MFLSADPTRTTRGDVIISFEPQIVFGGSDVTIPLSGLPYLTFDMTNWFIPQTVVVTGNPNDHIIEGGDTKVFPQALDLASNIQGPLIVQGGPGPDHSELTSREPVILPGETNFAPFANAGIVRGEVAQLGPAPASIGDHLGPQPAVIGEAADITDPTGAFTIGTITINARDALAAGGLRDYLGDLVGLPLGTTAANLATNLIGMSVDITHGTGKNKVRFITGVLSESDPNHLLPLVDDILILALNKPWETVSTEKDPLAAATFTNLAIPDQASVEVSRAVQGNSGVASITIGGTATTNDVLHLTFKNGATTFSKTYTVQAGDTTAKMAAGLLAALEGDPDLVNAGFGFSLVNTTLTVGLPSGYSATGTVTGPGTTESIAVVESVNNEVDVVTVTATSGSYELTLNGHTTAPIALDPLAPIATRAASVQAALVTLGLPGSASISGNGTVETLTIGSTTGTFALTFNGHTALGLSATISASALQTAIGASGIDPAKVTVTGTAGGPYTITFDSSLGAVASSVLFSGGNLDADHIKVVGTVQGDQTIYTISFLTGRPEALSVLVPDVSLYQSQGAGSILLNPIKTGVTSVQAQIDTLEINGNTGTFAIGFTNPITHIVGTTAPLANNINAFDLQNAIGDLPGIGLTNVTVTGNPNGPYTITFASQLGPVTLTTDALLLKRNEVQVLTVKQTSGSYTLTAPGAPHSPVTLQFDASAADVTAALATLFGLSPSAISVVKTTDPNPVDTRVPTLASLVGIEEVYTITFLGSISENLLVANVSTLLDAGTFTLTQTNPNLLVDPAAQVNILTVSDGDNPSNTTGTLNMLANPLIVSANKYPDLNPKLVYGSISGLGMGVDESIGGDLQPGGITFTNLQEVNVNLGNGGKNTFTIDTNNATGVYTGHTTLNVGGDHPIIVSGNRTINVDSIGGNTTINVSGNRSIGVSGNDTIHVSNAVHTMQSMQGLLTVGADVPQAVVTDLADGSPAGVSLGVGTLGTIQVQILASGGTFGLSFDGGTPTGDLAFNIPGGPTATLVTTIQGVKGTTSQVDQLVLGADGGQFELTLNDGINGPETTAAINWGNTAATAASIKSAIEALADFTGKVTSVTGTGTGIDPFVITFNNSLGNLGILVNGGVVNDAIRPPSNGLTLGGSLQTALNALTSIHDWIKTFDPADGSVSVATLGTIYRVNFLDHKGNPLTNAGGQPALPVDDNGNSLLQPVNDKLSPVFLDAVSAIQQLIVDATSGTFTLTFKGQTTTTTDGTIPGSLPFDVSGAHLQAALEKLSTIGTGNVSVVQAGNIYTITFGGTLAGAAQPLIEAHDFGLTNGAGQTNTITIDDSGFTSPEVAVLTSSTLTLAGTHLASATVGGTKPTAGDVITFVFTTGINTTHSVSYTVQLGDNTSTIAAGILNAFNGDLTPGNLVGKGYTFSVNGSTVAITPAAAGPYFPWQVQISGLNTETVTANAAADWGQPNSIQEIHLDATSGSFVLRFNGFNTGPLAWNISAATMQAALEGLPSIGSGNVAVTQNDDVYVLRFQGTLTNRAVTPVTVFSSALVKVSEAADGTLVTTPDSGTNAAGTTQLIQIFSRVPGQPGPAIDDVQTITMNATGGTYTLALPGRGGATIPLRYDASAEDIRSALQFALEANINKTDVEVAKYGNTYIISFEGQLRDQNGGSPIPLLVADTTGLTGGSLTIATRMDGLNYYGIQVMNLMLGSSTGDVLNVQGTGPGWHNSGAIVPGVTATTVHSVTNVTFGDGNNEAFISSNADVDQFTQPGFDFLTGNLDQLFGSINIDFAAGRHRLMVSDESETLASNASITDLPTLTSTAQGLAATNQIFITGLGQGGGGIGYTTGLNGNFFDGTQYWTGSGNDTVNISGTENRQSSLGLRTTTMLNTGLGDDHVTVNLQAAAALTVTQQGVANVTAQIETLAINATGGGTFTLTFNGLTTSALASNISASGLQTAITNLLGAGKATVGFGGGVYTITFAISLGSVSSSADGSALIGTDGFFVLNTMGGASAPAPGATTWSGPSDNDTVDASTSTLPLIIFGGAGYDNIIGGQGSDIIFGDFGRVQTLDVNGNLVATYGYGGRGDLISSLNIAAAWIYSTVPGPNVLAATPGAVAVGGNDIIQGNAGDDILIGGAFSDMIDGGNGDDLIFGDNVQLHNIYTWVGAAQSFVLANPRFEALTGTQIYTDIGATSDTVNVDGIGRAFRTQGGTYLPGWASWKITFLDQSNTIDASRAGSDYIAGGANDDQIFGQGGGDVIQGDGSIASGLTANTFTGGAPVPIQVGTAAGATPVFVTAQLGTLPVFALRSDPGAAGGVGALSMRPSFEAASDGNDYIEGGGGNNVIFGGLGQDDIIGGNSELFSLTTAAQRPTGSNMIFGGAGTEADRNDVDVQLLTITATGGSFKLTLDAQTTSAINAGASAATVQTALAALSNVGAGNVSVSATINGGVTTYSIVFLGGLPAAGPVNPLIVGAPTVSALTVNISLLTGGTASILATAAGDQHARDADVIVADNGDIFDLVGTGNGSIGTDSGGFLTFNYDSGQGGLIFHPGGSNPANYYGGVQFLIPRAVRLLDYTRGGLDFSPAALNDIGGAGEIHGESGDDVIYGGPKSDILFGDAQNDQIIGGAMGDWISGGAGDDGILGDDGRLIVSRNSTAYGEPLYGVAAFTASTINLMIRSNDIAQTALINVDQMLKYTADLTPDNLKPGQVFGAAPSELFAPQFANDIIFGGLGNDWIHGGSGDDAILGGEASGVASYITNYAQNGTQIAMPNGTVAGKLVVESDFAHPFNPGNPLGFKSTLTGTPTNTSQDLGKFALYDANNPLREVLLTTAGLNAPTGTPGPNALLWFLDNNANEGPIDTHWIIGQNTYIGLPTDGDDNIFGDLGNDWVVGGTGRDIMFGGWGNDMLNADDVLTTLSGTNLGTDTNPSYEDLAYGGAGLDVLIANTNGDRLLDWVGEFNTMVSPYAQYGAMSVQRYLLPSIPAYLLALSQGVGADQTFAAQYGSDPARSGEPFGELGMVLQKDAAYSAQKGSPRDPQAGNIGGGKVDLSNSNATAGTQPIWQVEDGTAPTATDAAVTYTDADLAAIVAAAEQLWTQALGAGDPRLAVFDKIVVAFGNLPDGMLGATLSGTILLDRTAAGAGWFVDATPFGNSEFQVALGGGAFAATPGSPAYGHFDLLTTVLHELGNAMGFAEDQAQDVTGMTLQTGVRRLPTGDPAVPPPIFDIAASQINLPGIAGSQINLLGLPNFNSDFIPPSAITKPGSVSTQLFHQQSGSLVDQSDAARWGWLLDGLNGSQVDNDRPDWLVRGAPASHAASVTPPGIQTSAGASVGLPSGETTEPAGDDLDGPIVNWNQSFSGLKPGLGHGLR